jgi:hypothetical protein
LSVILTSRPESADYAKKGDHFFHRLLLSAIPKVHSPANISLRRLRGFQHNSRHLYLFYLLQFYFTKADTEPGIYCHQASCGIFSHIFFNKFSDWFYADAAYCIPRVEPAWACSAFPLFPACTYLRYIELFLHPAFRGTFSFISYYIQNYHHSHCGFIQLSYPEKFYFQGGKSQAQGAGIKFCNTPPGR